MDDRSEMRGDAMLARVHDHLVSELQQSARTDTVFVVTAVAFDLIILGINWSVADDAARTNASVAAEWTFPVLLGATILVNFFTIRALFAGRRTRLTLLNGLLAMYRDQNAEKYYDPTLLNTYGRRYELFAAVIICLAAVALLVPTLERFLGS
jgi:hypothetical protein